MCCLIDKVCEIVLSDFNSGTLYIFKYILKNILVDLNDEKLGFYFILLYKS